MTTEAPTKRKNLFDIGEELIAIEEMIEAAEGDIGDPAEEAWITEWLESAAEAQASKVDCYINLVRSFENKAAAAGAEEDRYKKAKTVNHSHASRLLSRLKQHMEKTSQLKIETATGRTVTIQKNGGVAPLIVSPDVDPTQLSPKFQKLTIELDTKAVRAAIAAGEEVAFASLGERGTSLRIK